MLLCFKQIKLYLIHKSQKHSNYLVLGVMFQLDNSENRELADFFEVLGAAHAQTYEDHEHSFLKLYRSLRTSLSSHFFQRDYDLADECDLDDNDDASSHAVKVSWFVAKHPLKISYKQVNRSLFIFKSGFFL